MTSIKRVNKFHLWYISRMVKNYERCGNEIRLNNKTEQLSDINYCPFGIWSKFKIIWCSNLRESHSQNHSFSQLRFCRGRKVNLLLVLGKGCAFQVKLKSRTNLVSSGLLSTRVENRAWELLRKARKRIVLICL